MGNLSDNLLLLITKVSQYNETREILNSFVEGMQAFSEGNVFLWSNVREKEIGCEFKVYTKKKTYGYLYIVEGELTLNESISFKNALSMLALIIEKKEQDKVFENENISSGDQEQSAHFSQMKILSLVKNIPDVLLRYDIEQRCVFASENIDQLFGKQASEIIGKKNEDLGLSEEQYKYLKQKIEIVIATKEPAEDYFIVSGGDEDIVYDWRVIPEFGDDRMLQSVLVVVRNITEKSKNERALRESEEKYKVVFESSPNLLLVLHQGIFLYINPKASELLGYNPENELTEQNILKSIHPDYHVILLDRLRELDKANKKSSATLEIITKDKHTRFIDIVSVPIKYGGKDCTLIIGQDVTDRVITEEELYAHIEELKVTTEALEQSEEKYRLLVENQGEGVGVTDENNVFTFVNNAAAEIFGANRDEMVGKSLKQFTSVETFNEILKETGIRKFGEKSTYEIEIIREDGKKRWILLTASPNFDHTGAFVSSFGIFRDITDRKIAARALKRSEQIMRSFIDQSYEGIMMINSQGKVIEWNRSMCDITGYDYNYFKGKYTWDVNYALLPKEKRTKEIYELLKEKANSVLTNQDYKDFNKVSERNICSKNGQSIVIQQITFPIKLQDELIIGSLMLDITERKKYVEKLNVEKKRAENYFNAAGSILVVIDVNERIEDINERGCELLKDSRENIIGKNWFDDYLPEEIREDVRTRFAAFVDQKPDELYELFKRGHVNKITNKAKETRFIKWFNNPLFDENKKLIGVLSSGIDITKTYEKEEELKETSLLLETTLNAIPDIIGIQGLNHEMIRYNNAGYEVLNVDEKNVVGKKCYELIGRVEPCNECATDLVYKSKKAEEIIRFEDSLNAWLDIRSYPILNEDGEIKMVIEHLRDITKNVEAEQELKKIRIAMEQSPASIVITSLTGEIEFVNPKFTETTGYNFEEAIGANPRVLKSGRHNKEFYEDLWKTITSGKVWKGEISNKKKNGELYWENALISPIKDENNQITHYIAIKENISDKKDLEQMRYSKEVAERSARLKQQFLANMSHEMRTPMNGIIGMTDILMNTELDEMQYEYLKVIKESSQSLLYLISDVLDISRIEQGKMELIPEVFNLKETIRNLKEMFYPTITEKKLSLYIHIDPNYPEKIYADENKLKQIISNLLSNAIKYTNEGEIIVKVNIVKKSRKLLKSKVEVIDTGIGIKKEDQAELFTIFSRIDDSYTRKTEGTGLGLAIAKKITEMMNGRIGVISEPGQGSNFWFEFEAQSTEETETPKKKNNLNTTHKVFDSLNILYAEDKVVNQKVVSLMLEKAGCEVVIAENGLEVLDKFCENKFDIILMDIMMPEMDGITAMKRLQETGKKLPPIIGLSANAMEGDAEKYINMGMNDYLTKPINRDLLMQKLSEWSQRSNV